MTLLITFLYILFVLSAIVLVVVILLQEGKGGGLTDALGTSGQQTFGVGASGINKFTGWVGGIFMVSALLIHMLNRMEAQSSVLSNLGTPQVEPVQAGNGATPPAAPPVTPPASNPAPAGGTPADQPK